jgi:ketosteroid isomerase-like protein
VSESANVALVRSIYADWERGDFSSTVWAHPEIEFVFADGPSPGRWKGLAGMAEANRDWLSAWADVRQEVDSYREIDGERVLVLHRFGARGKRSGLDLQQMRREGAGLFHVRGGEVVRIVHYFDRERALADLGLAPEGGSSHA